MVFIEFIIIDVKNVYIYFRVFVIYDIVCLFRNVIVIEFNV